MNFRRFQLVARFFRRGFLDGNAFPGINVMIYLRIGAPPNGWYRGPWCRIIPPTQMMYDQALLDQIRAATDLGELVGGYVPLKAAGANSLKGLCPFHQEKTPSFHVNTAQQFFKCFGCNAGGNAFTFLMRLENLQFPEAVKRLAERAKIALPDSDRPEDRERGRLLQVMETAAELYHRTLMSSPEGARARAHLAERKMSREAIETFRLGFAGGRELAAAKLHPAVLAKAGLLGPTRDGGQADRMRGRLVVPIRDESGHVIGFGGRALDEGQQPKYLNTSETPLFKKSGVLFGLDRARDAIRKAGAAVLVEGYFDAIALQVHGVTNAVAVLGTALTEAQLKLLKRIARLLLIVYDEDVGGNEAAVRGLDLATEAGFEVQIVRLPGGHDPDEFIIARGLGAFQQALGAAAGAEAGEGPLDEAVAPVSLFDFRFEVAARHADLATLTGRRQLVQSLLPYLARVPDAIERFAYVRRLATRLDLREQDVEEELHRFRDRAAPAPAARTPSGAGASLPAAGPAPVAAERILLAGVFGHRGAALDGLLALPPEAFPSPAGVRVAGRVRALIESGEAFSIASLLDEFRDEPAAVSLLTEGADGQAAPSEEACHEAAAQLAQRHRRAELRDLSRRIGEARDPAAVAGLMESKRKLAGADHGSLPPTTGEARA